MFLKWLPLTDDNGNYGAHSDTSSFSIRRLITGRLHLIKGVKHFDLNNNCVKKYK